MKISEEKELDILLAQLHERYEALHKMRDRSMQFVLWILGIGLGMAWLLISDKALTFPQKLAVTILLFILGIVTWCFISAIERGFNSNHKIIIRIEKALRLYDINRYGMSESVLPSKYSHQKFGWTGHFRTLYMLIITVFISLVVLVWTNPCKSEPEHSPLPANTGQTQTQNKVDK